MFARLGLPDPGPLRVLPLHHQVAQKLHACTGAPKDGANDRARDLVDLQLVAGQIDTATTAVTARRLFGARQEHPWPPEVVAHEDWPRLYDDAARGLGVRQSVEEAVVWTNDLIARIDAAA